MKKAYLYFVVMAATLSLWSCSAANKSSSPVTENAESDAAGQAPEEISDLKREKLMKQIFIPEQKFIIEKVESLKEVSEGEVKKERKKKEANDMASSENEQLSVSNKNAKVFLFAKKLKTGMYPIAKNTMPYATVEINIEQGTENVRGELKNGTVTLFVLDSAGITKGKFEGTLIKNDERYFIGGNFSN